MKYILIYTTLFCAGISCFAQDSLKIGAFFSLAEYKNNSPSINNVFIIKKRTFSDLRWNGGNDYKVESAEPAIKNRDIKYRIWGINRGDTLFVNGWKLGLGLWYIKALTRGRYIGMEAGVPGAGRLLKQMRKARLYNPAGGILKIGGPFQYNTLRFLFVYDARENVVELLNEQSLLKIMEPDMNLIKSYNEESKKDKETLLKYLELINNRKE